MTHKVTIGITALAALGCAAGAFFLVRARGEHPVPEVIASEPPGFREAPPANRLGTDAAARSPSHAKSKKTPPPADAGLPLRAGEVLDYTANVSKLNNVANLRLRVAGRGNFLGKSTWHLQAFAHTENALRMVFELDDQFDSYSDAVTMTSLQYEMHLNERGQKVDSVQRMTASGNEPAPADAARAARNARSSGDDAVSAESRLGKNTGSTQPGLRRAQAVRRARKAGRPFGKCHGPGGKLYRGKDRHSGFRQWRRDEGCLLPLVPREQRGADAGASRSDDAVRDGARGAAESELRNPESKGAAARLGPEQSLARL
ncbi:MAG: hypothetical protein DMG43_09775 [Acidobacteria bacterium]|nr:MAG: hypothetical protein DMG43_09775 [Acidobacteriota bacterium]